MSGRAQLGDRVLLRWWVESKEGSVLWGEKRERLVL